MTIDGPTKHPLLKGTSSLWPFVALCLFGCSSSPSSADDGGASDAAPDNGVADVAADAAADASLEASCAPLSAIDFDAGTPGTFSGKAGAACKRDIDCLDGTFCVVVFETCAKSTMILGPGKGGRANGGGACRPQPAFPADCDPLALDWSDPVDISQNASSLAESDSTVLTDGHGKVLVAWANNTTVDRQFNGLSLSEDDGKSFMQIAAPVHLPTDSENDAFLATDDQGLLYYVWEGYGKNFTGAQDVWLATSQDGKTWSAALQVDSAGDNGGGTIPLDFPYVAVNPVNRKPYVTYQVTSSAGPVPMKLVVGSPGGTSVAPSVELDDGTRPMAFRDLANGVFDTAGSFYASWVELGGTGGSTGQGLESGDPANGVYFTRVDVGGGDAGVTGLGHDVLVNGQAETVLFGVPKIQVTRDGSSVFVVYSAGENDAIDLRVAVSHDRGLTFGPSVKINDDATCATHYKATATLDPKGRLWVLWYDNRDGAGHIVYAVSDDSGKSFHPNRLVTPSAFPFETFQYSVGWLGDYFQVVAGGGEIFAAWADPHDGDRSHINFAKAILPP